MRENRLYGSEGGGAACRAPYPYVSGCPSGTRIQVDVREHSLQTFSDT